MSEISATLLCALLGAACALAGAGWMISLRRASRSAEMLAATRQEISGILDGLTSGLIILDADGRVRRFNPAARRILGVGCGDSAGLHHSEVLAGGAAPFGECLQKVLDDGRALVRHEVGIRRGSDDVPVGVTVTPTLDSGGAATGLMAIFQDLTEAVRMRDRIREADRLAAVGELSASIAHEIRNPLGSIRGSAEILSGELELDGNLKRLLELILKESGRVNRIISDFLAFARMRPTRTRRIAVAGFLDQVAFQIGLQARRGDGEVRVEIPEPPAGLELDLDEEQMTQVMLNLALNACAAMEYDGRLRIGAAIADGGGECVLTIEDEGPGVPTDQRDEIFKPFFTTRKGGTGLGLPMVARIVHAHGGDVSVSESTLGGACFRVRLPLPAESDAEKDSRAVDVSASAMN